MRLFAFHCDEESENIDFANVDYEFEEEILKCDLSNEIGY